MPGSSETARIRALTNTPWIGWTCDGNVEESTSTRRRRSGPPPETNRSPDAHAAGSEVSRITAGSAIAGPAGSLLQDDHDVIAQPPEKRENLKQPPIPAL